MTNYPLAPGHYYGPKSLDIKAHDGNGSPEDTYNIALWQRQFSLDYDRERPITGRFDGPTQRAVVEVQRLHGLDITGTLDAPTWHAVFDRLVKARQTAVEPRTEPGAPEVPPALPEGSEAVSEAAVVPSPKSVRANRSPRK